jgi:hypothetical protein
MKKFVKNIFKHYEEFLIGPTKSAAYFQGDPK